MTSEDIFAIIATGSNTCMQHAVPRGWGRGSQLSVIELTHNLGEAAQDVRDDVVTNGGSHADYKEIRKSEYIKAVGDIPDQLDYIYHNGLDAWKAEIKKVKDKYTKP